MNTHSTTPPSVGPHADCQRDTPALGTPLFAALLCGGAIMLLLQLRTETQWFTGMPWPLQPRFWPAVSLLGLALTSGWVLWQTRTQHGDRPDILAELRAWARPTEFAGWFAAYAALVPWLGYPLATILFLAALGRRAGICTGKGHLMLLGTGIAIILLFRTLLAINMPPGTIYEFLPPKLRSFVVLYF